MASFSDIPNLFTNAWRRFTGVVSSIWRSIFGGSKTATVSPEFKAALKNPVVKYGDKYALNPDLDLNSWSVRFTDGLQDDTFKKRPIIESKNLRLRPVGYGLSPDQIHKDIDFMATKLYGDVNVTATYATGRSYNPMQAIITAVNRFNMFSQRFNSDKPCAFTGFVIELKATDEPIGVINVGTTDIAVNGEELNSTGTIVEPALMLASDHHRKGYASEAAVLGLLYLSQLRKDGYRTPGGAEFKGLAFTARPGNPIPARLGAKVIGQSDKFGKEPEHVRDVYMIDADAMVSLVEKTIERDTAERRPTLKLH